MKRTIHPKCSSAYSLVNTIALALALTLVGCSPERGAKAPSTPPAVGSDSQPTSNGYRATIHWTSFGVPHIVADQAGSLGFGQGYAFATMHVCTLADQIVKVRGERARFFGPGKDNGNIESDFGYRALGFIAKAEKNMGTLDQLTRDMLQGFAHGYNKYISDTGLAALPEGCTGAEWVRPITVSELVGYVMSSLQAGSSRAFLSRVAAAKPPGANASARRPSPELGIEIPAPPHGVGAGSNGWAIGSEKSANGRGLLLANPHFPWEGEMRFYEVHLTIPGELDVYGATLMGAPGVAIGFNRNLAWTHTWSASSKFVLYRLSLDSSAPTRYRYGDQMRDMEAQEHSIQVRQDDGSLLTMKRAFYRSHYGPMVVSKELPWTKSHAFTLRDVGSPRVLDHWMAMMRATDLEEFQASFAKYGDTSFANTIYADDQGNAWYIDSSAVPDLSPMAIGAWQLGLKTIPELQAAWDRGIVVLDGSMPLFELQSESPMPGQVPYARAPKLLRRDYVMNSNDSFWLSNPAQPLQGYSPLYGRTDSQVSLRTRMNHQLIAEVDKYTLADLERQHSGNRALSVELLRDALVARCQKAGSKLARACATLAGWDGTFNVDSRGAVLWRETVAALPKERWAEPFDAKRPLATPRGLAPAAKKAPDPVAKAIETALANLAKAGIDPYESTLGDTQYTMKAGKRIPVPGSNFSEGSINPTGYNDLNSTLLPKLERGQMLNSATGLTADGYPVNTGTSFLLAIAFEENGPRARGIMTYSGSSDPRSPHFSDQTELYSSGKWRPVLFTSQDIQSDPALKTQVVTGPKAP